MSQKNIEKRFVVTNIDELDRIQAEGKSMVLYTGHIGNWEWFSFIPLLIKHKFASLYQQLSNPYFDELMYTLRTFHGAVCIESRRGYKAILERTREGIPTIYMVIGDQSPSGNASKHWVDFFGRETAFLEGASRIAQKTGLMVAFPVFHQPKRGYYEVTFEIIEPDPKATTAEDIIHQYVRKLEKSISEEPALWLWSHKRWKHKRPVEETAKA